MFYIFKNYIYSLFSLNIFCRKIYKIREFVRGYIIGFIAKNYRNNDIDEEEKTDNDSELRENFIIGSSNSQFKMAESEIKVKQPTSIRK